MERAGILEPQHSPVLQEQLHRRSRCLIDVGLAHGRVLGFRDVDRYVGLAVHADVLDLRHGKDAGHVDTVCRNEQ